MLLLLKLVLIFVFFLIFYQDSKDRMVYWFLYLAVGILGFSIQLFYHSWQSILTETSINLFFVLVLILMSYIYTKFITGKKFINESIGKGDIFLFLTSTFLFPILTFCILFIVSLLFSLIIHLMVSIKKENDITVPLAGYMSFFWGFIYLTSLFLGRNILFIL